MPKKIFYILVIIYTAIFSGWFAINYNQALKDKNLVCFTNYRWCLEDKGFWAISPYTIETLKKVWIDEYTPLFINSYCNN